MLPRRYLTGMQLSKGLLCANTVKYSVLGLKQPISYNLSYYISIRHLSKNVHRFRSLGTKSVDDYNNKKLKWKDLRDMVDLPEYRDKGLKVRIGGIKDQIVKLGGVRVVVFYVGR